MTGVDYARVDLMVSLMGEVDLAYRQIARWPEISPDSEQDWCELSKRLQKLSECADRARINVPTVIL